jgi:hypothetical protein
MTAPLAADYELIRVNCHNCGKRHRLAPGSAGKQFRCRKCGMKLTVPGQVGQQPAPPRGRPVRSWAIWLGGVATATIAVSVLRMDVKPVVAEQPPAPVEVAEAEPEPEPEEPVQEAPPPPPPGPRPAPPVPVAQAAPAQKEQPPAPPETDDAEETYKLGLRYETGDGIEKDTEAAAMCYEEAANAGHAESMYKIGLCHCIGKGVDKDEAAGKEWLKQSAAKGHPDAKLALEVLEAGVPPLAVLAAAWMTHPVGDGLRQKDKDKSDKEELEDENGRHLSPREVVERRMAFANRLLYGGRRKSVYEPWRSFNSPAESRQRDRFISGMRQQQANANVQRSIRGK